MINEQGSKVYLYATFVDRASEAANVSGTPLISIFHRQGTQDITDIASKNMSNISGTSYYYKWSPTSRAFKGDYIAKYSVDYTDNTNVVGVEEFQIVDRGHYSKVVGGLVHKGSGKTIIKDTWTTNEKESLIKKVNELGTGLDSIEVIKDVFSEKVRVLDDLKEKIVLDSEKRDGEVAKIDSIVKTLQKSSTDVKEKDMVKIMGELNSFKIYLKEMKEMDRDLRIPTILAGLDDLRIGLENLQEDLVKTLSTNSLEQGVLKNEKTK